MFKEGSLKSKTVSSLKWSALDKLASSSIQFAIGVFIARLLLPSDYGLVGMITVFIAFSQSLIDGGFSSALIQKKNPENKDYSTSFYFNVFVGIILYAILFFASPFIAKFYNQPILENLSQVMGLNFIIISFSITQTAYLNKHLNFKTQTKISVLTAIISGIIGVIAAYNGLGVWAIVIQTLSRNLINTIIIWFSSTWFPSLEFSFDSLKSMFKFGSRLMGSNILNVVSDNIYSIVIGKYYSAQDLGFYSRSSQLNQFPASSVTSVLQRVFLPVFSQLQDENSRLIAAYRKAIKLIAFLMFPLMFGLGAVAKPLVLILLTGKWLPVVPMLQIMVLFGMFYPIHAINLNILNVKGRSDLFFNLEIIKKILTGFIILVTISLGLKAMIIGAVFLSGISFFINTYYTKKIFGYGPLNQIKDFYSSFILAFLMGVLVYIICNYINNPYISLLVSIPTGIVFYVLISLKSNFEQLVEIKTFFTKNGN